MIYAVDNDGDRFYLTKHGVPVFMTRNKIKSLNLKMSKTAGLKMGQRIIITPETQHLLPNGWNWVDSCPYVKGWGRKEVVVTQAGYPYLFTVPIDDYWRMRKDYLVNSH